MTHTDYTKKILRIEDNNIYFDENCLEIRKEGNKEINVFHGYLTYIPESCIHCGCVNNGTNDIIKWAYDKNCLVKIPKVSTIILFFYLINKDSIVNIVTKHFLLPLH